MFSTRSKIPVKLRASKYTLRPTYLSKAYSSIQPPQYGSQITEADISAAQKYCSNLIQKLDTPSYTLQPFIPPSARPAYLCIRALNIELARIPDLISNPTVGSLRMQFWRDNITRTFASSPPKEPVALLLYHTLTMLRSQNPGISTGAMKAWFMKVINTREKYMDNRPYTDLAALEMYAENTYSTLMYLTLAAVPLHSMAVDHVASHIGKACGIVAVLRGLPLIAFPPPGNHHSNNGAFGGGGGERQGAVVLPLDVMAESGVKEEDVLRYGGQAEGLKDAVFTVATRANDHLITAREMMKNLRGGKDAGHDFEHEGEEGHVYDSGSGSSGNVERDLAKGLGVLMQAVPTRLWLEKLEKANFDIFRPELRGRDWRLPWSAYWAYSRRKL